MNVKKKFIENLLSLFTLQGLNYLLPFVTLPYLIRVLGTENYGLVAFATAFMQYFVIVTDYGFNMTATRKVSINRDSQVEISKIFSTVSIIKTFLMIISFIIMLIIVCIVPSLRVDIWVYLCAFLIVVGQGIFPIWLFQGMEHMKYITIVNVIAKLIATFCIFIFVRSSYDYTLAVFIQSSGYVIAGIFSLYYAKKLFNVQLKFNLSFKDTKQYLKEGGQVFISTLSGNVYGQGTVLITGFILGQTAVGYYSIAQKISSAVVGVIHPIAQTIYPYLCNLVYENGEKYFKLRKLFILAGTFVGACLGLLLYLFSGLVDELITGTKNPDLVILLKIYSFVLFFTMMNVLLNPFILSMEKFKEMQNMYVIISILFLVISIPCTLIFGNPGMAYSILIVELYIFIMSLKITNQKELDSANNSKLEPITK